jgi:peptidylprolyl isomerase
MITPSPFHSTIGVFVRPHLKAAAALVLTSLVLAGCSGTPDSNSSASPLAKSGITVPEDQLPTVSGAFGELPTIAFPLKPGASLPSPSASPSDSPGSSADADTSDGSASTPEPSSSTDIPVIEASPLDSAEPSPSESVSPYLDAPVDLQVMTLIEGTGEEVKPDNLVAVDMTVWQWGETTTLMETYSGALSVFPVRTDNSNTIGMSRTVVAQKVGSRVVGVIPPAEGTLASYFNLDTGVTLVVVLDIHQQFPKDIQAQADAEPTGASTGPKIVGQLGGPAHVTIPLDADAPTEVSTILIAKGTGPAVEEGQEVLLHWAATDWAGKDDGSTWTDDQGPQAVTINYDPYGDGSLTAFSGLVGLPIGSRVLVLLPGQLGSYLADAIVMDIVALVERPTATDQTDPDADDGASPTTTPSADSNPSATPSPDTSASTTP